MLSLAAKHGRYHNVMLLLDAGANINGQDSTGFSALHEAAVYNQFEVVLLLLERGADYKIEDDWGNRFTHTIVPKLQKKLLDEGSDAYRFLQEVMAFLESEGESLDAIAKSSEN